MLLNIITAAFFVSAISLAGVLLLIQRRLLDHGNAGYLVSFAAGVMLATAFLDLLPEAQELSVDSMVFLPVLVGIVLFFFMERFLLWFHHHDDTHKAKPTATLVLFGDSIHNIVDGIAIASTFLTSPTLGVVTTLAIAAHEIPQELADFTILIQSGMKKTRAIAFNFLSGLSAIVGAAVAYFALSATTAVLPLFLSFTAGMFIYIACSDLIPELHRDFDKRKGWGQSLPLLGGILVSFFLIRLLEG